ncbi:hypothetical protein F7725_024524 [Dissostichus mawsoni]|uniref:Uncharacterized protein n=1 Tax=Dissostichus mawsoni TaxID=36200 RepID=A0A7J5Y0I5_DISMA|nr:hypothetical protein F7725_024524 [Dissostichus mawsoni]
MESEESDTPMSEEEADEDAFGQVDKENQQPNDRPVNATPLKTPKRGRPSSANGSPAPTVTSRSPLNAQKRPSSGDGSPPNGAPSKRYTPSTGCTQGPNGTFSSEDKERTLQTLQ